MSKPEMHRERVQKGAQPNIMMPFENIKPCDYDAVITGLQGRLKAAEKVINIGVNWVNVRDAYSKLNFTFKTERALYEALKNYQEVKK